MIRVCLALLLLAAIGSSASAATLTLPTITIVNPPSPSVSITCVQVSPLPFAPVAPATALFHCSVAPADWTGTVTLSGGNSLTLGPTTGNLFDVIVGPTALAAGTYAPGTITSTP
jgi:hypothetical protein